MISKGGKYHMSQTPYPHDGSEILGEVTGAAKPRAANNPHRCTRGNCGQKMASHEDQDEHNSSAHLSSPPNRTPPPGKEWQDLTSEDLANGHSQPAHWEE